jgi:hypothetical protein
MVKILLLLFFGILAWITFIYFLMWNVSIDFLPFKILTAAAICYTIFDQAKAFCSET